MVADYWLPLFIRHYLGSEAVKSLTPQRISLNNKTDSASESLFYYVGQQSYLRTHIHNKT